MTLGWKSIFLLGHSLISSPFFPLSTGSSIYYSTRRSRIWDDRGIERRREKMVDDHPSLSLSLIDSFLNASTTWGSLNEQRNITSGRAVSTVLGSGIVLTRDVWSKTKFLSFLIFHFILVSNMNIWFGFGSKPRLS